MKKIITFVLLTFFILQASSCSYLNRVKGDKNVVTKEIKIQDYEAITLSSNADVIYETKQDADPFLSIEIDENLIPYIDIKNKDNQLTIGQSDKAKIDPTKFVIRTNSKVIRSIRAMGNGDFVTQGQINSDNISLQLIGNGDIIMDSIEAGTIDASLIGNGDIKLKGKAELANYSLVGNGDITAKDLEAKNARGKVIGNGNISMYAKEKLEAKLVGNGDIQYKTDSTTIVDRSKTGHGNINEIK